MLNAFHIYSHMIKLQTLLLEAKYEYGAVMAQIPPVIAASIIQFGKSIIPDEFLYFDPTGKEEYGRETEPHITIKFGLTQLYSRGQLQQFFVGSHPFNITIRNLGVFKNPKFDVVKINVEPDAELIRLRSVFDALPNADEHKEYHPHITLAYVKSGIGKKFENRTGKGFSKIPINTIKYSDRNQKFYFTI